MPAVSVIIPTFNREKQVALAVESVLNQQVTDCELIVVDDGSTDQTVNILSDRFGDRIRLVSQPHRGVSAARNLGADEACGRFLAFLDADDRWLPDKLARQIAYHQTHDDCSISQTQEIWIRHGRFVNPGKKHRKPEGYIFPHSLRLCAITPSSVMIDRKLWRQSGGFDEDLAACEDYDLWLRLTAHHPVALIDETLLTKTGGHADQLSRRYPAMDRFRLYSLFKIYLSGTLSEEQAEQVQHVSREKLEILSGGLRKRRRPTADLDALAESVFNREIDPAAMTWKAKALLLDHSRYQ